MDNNLHVPKPRGRPFGSKNKRKEPGSPSESMEQDHVPIQREVLEIAVGADVISVVSDFANRLKVDVNVISTHGMVCDVTLYQPNPVSQISSVFNYNGIYQLLSLRGNFYGSTPMGGQLQSFFSSHVVYFVDHVGNPFAGLVAGQLLAATKVFLGVSIIRESDCIKLPLIVTPPTSLVYESEVCSSAGSSMTTCGGTNLTPGRSCSRIANGYLCACAFK